MYPWALSAFRRVRSSSLSSQTNTNAPILAIFSYIDNKLNSRQEPHTTSPLRCSFLPEKRSLVKTDGMIIYPFCNPHISPGLFRSTRINLFIPPQLMRLLMLASFAIGQAFIIAYHTEKKNIEREESMDGSEGSYPQVSHPDRPPMSSLEALCILGLDHLRPRLKNTSSPFSSQSNLFLPLKTPEDREIARQNFERMFAIAVKYNNHFLAGKLSAAYRKCVDPTWDHVNDSQEEPQVGDSHKDTHNDS
ncbi:unnamed protein product [Phytomonas sp. Hart1]|nr:unnamed protein product [Phytomonas sp. Hart1]|eukprot:CCW69433.1 unnamed protein product [Phytomonas sp. isolate Hart1]